MNSKILEYAYEMIHKLEVKNIAHKDEIGELKREVQELTNQLIAMHNKEVV